MNTKELYEILLSEKPSTILREREEELFKLIPELETCKGFNQNSEWHIYDVYEHILHVVDNVPPRLTLRLAALFHDIGKPASYREDEKGVGHFYGHWQISETIFHNFAKKHKMTPQTESLISNLIFYHDLNIGRLSKEDSIKLYDTLGTNGLILLYKLKKADLLAQNEKFHDMLTEFDTQKRKILTMIKKNNCPK